MTAGKVKLLVLGVVILVFAAWEGGKPYTTASAHISIALAIAAVVLAALYGGRNLQEVKSFTWLKATGGSIRRYLSHPGMQGTGVLVWLIFFMAYFGWDLNSFLHEQHDLPTLSYLIGRVTRYYIGRFLFVTGWLLVGWYLAFGNLRKGDVPPLERGVEDRGDATT
ncbi:MAG: hypothetical protein ACYDGY_01615 [Acidimicrobiales bacterium]